MGIRVKKKDSYAESHKNSKKCVLMTDLGLIVLACFSPQTAKFYLKTAVVTTKFGINLAVSRGHFQNDYTRQLLGVRLTQINERIL